MKRLLFATAVFLLLLFLVVAAYRAFPTHVYDGFESTRLSWMRWSRYRFVPGAVVMQQAIVRSGRRAAAITVHQGDCYEEGTDGNASTERAELMESWWLFSRTGRKYIYSFSLYLPNDFPQTSQRLVLAQWKELCEAPHCRSGNPVLAIRYTDGRLQVTRHDTAGKSVLYQSVEDVRGRWLDFRFAIRFDASGEGNIAATLNGQEIVRYRGPTVYRPGGGYPSHGFVYFKTGLYRDALREAPWTIYVDEYRKDQCSSEDCQ